MATELGKVVDLVGEATGRVTLGVECEGMLVDRSDTVHDFVGDIASRIEFEVASVDFLITTDVACGSVLYRGSVDVTNGLLTPKPIVWGVVLLVVMDLGTASSVNMSTVIFSLE